MRRHDSLPPCTPDRGSGLADLKGRDPMDRRVEVEKKERYAQALREQMAENSARRDYHPDEASESSAAGWGHRRAGSQGRQMSSLMMDDSPLQSPHAYDGGGGGGGGGRSRSGRASPLLPTGAGLGGGGGDLNQATADKLAKVQDIMAQRLRALQEEQHKQWQRVQDSLRDGAAAAREAAMDAVRRHCEDALDAQLRPLMGDLANARREMEAQAAESRGQAEEIAAVRRASERLAALAEERDRQISALEAEIERSSASHRECAAFRAEAQRGLREAMETAASVRREQDALAQRVADVQRVLQQHDADIERLKRAHEDCARFRAECASERQAVQDALAKLQVNLEALARRVEDFPEKLRKLRDEMARIADRAARDAVAGMRPPEPAPAPAPVRTLVMPDVSEEAYAVLRNADGQCHELPGLKNVVGRAPACSAVIPYSQAISNRHASVDFDIEGRVSIRDLGSRNGTFLNERRVPEDAGLMLQSGDSVQLGVDGPCYSFEFGPAYYARWPAEPVRIGQRELAGDRRNSASPSVPRPGGRRPRS
eukprot:TRINITY_DN739_c1_g1_i1.p1 TRINITY_DN739_c1_g1~~TRINITY_DN739_c1_g1_i1.p1  ORF type:complete len:542 (-),score=126.79 TRINITY_DN739_c1_g1_i1:264-1889(-)